MQCLFLLQSKKAVLVIQGVCDYAGDHFEFCHQHADLSYFTQ